MQEPSGRTAQIQTFLERLLQGDGAARMELHKYTYGRFLRLSKTKLCGDSVHVQELTGDVWHTAWIEVEKDLDGLAEWKKGEDNPNEPHKLARHFLNRVATIIHRLIVDIGRRRSGPKGKLVRTGGDYDPAYNPADPFVWDDVHEQVASLPDQEREIVKLHIYSGLHLVEIADLLGTPATTVKGRWRRAIKKLRKSLASEDRES